MTTLNYDCLECDGDCGARIEISVREGKPDLNAVAEVLGWTTRDAGNKQEEIYCQFCQKRARRILNG